MRWMGLLVLSLASEARAEDQTIRAEHMAASALLCADAKARSDAVTEIKAEQKYAREGGGVVDVVKIHDQQIFMRGIDQNIGEVRAWLTRHRLSAIACKDHQVGRVASCIQWAMYDSTKEPFWELKDDPSCAEAGYVMDVYRNTND